ncbi:MAG: discoidin domain-containing protein [Akkermansiaceae bacterium]|nr:discoidin domain-containing protein [Akkermansiaceae bacterium]
MKNTPPPRSRCSILVGLCGALTACLALADDAPTPVLNPYPERETITLRSAFGHGGATPWQMKPASETDDGAAVSSPGSSSEGWQNAIVPGTVLNSLVAAGVYPEPYFGVNNKRGEKRIPDISEVGAAFYTYWFRSKFTIPASFAGKKVWMQFDGINYKAGIWLNGQKRGDMAGMFNRGLFDISQAAVIGGDNVLAVLVHPIDPPNGFKPRSNTGGSAQNENRNGADGKIGAYTTMLMTCGWDFTFKDGIRDRNTGIWRDVKVFATGPVLLRHPFVKSELPVPDLSSAKETLSVEVRNASDIPQRGELIAAIEENNLTLRQPVELQPGETKTVGFAPEKFAQLHFKNPRVWWPFHKGAQPLYRLKFSFEQKSGVSDTLKTRFAIRDVRSDRNTPDKSRIFYVNGERFFITGSNWIPEAMCRTSDERTRAELLYTRQSGVNFLRFWAGGVTESDYFFDACDELGILTWVEFWQTGDTVIPADQELYRANVADTVKRIRNHPSVAYYVSANERQANNIVPIKDILDQLDGTRGYQAGSETDGIHDGSPYGTCNPMWYYEDTGSDRGSRLSGFNPEYGTPILPTIDALREMMDEKDLWPINKQTWDYLDGDGFHGMTRLYDQAVRQYGDSSGIEEYAWKAQMFGSVAYKALWEAWNAQRFEYGERFSSGLLFWYHNSPNRQTCGRMWDWSLEPTAALYASQSAHEPLHIQYDFLKNTVGVNNEHRKAFPNQTATVRILNLDMKEVYRKALQIDVPADRFVKDILKVEQPENLSPVYFLKLTLADAAGKIVSDNFYWSSQKPYKPGRTLTGPLFQGMASLENLPKTGVKTTVSQSSRAGRNFHQVSVDNSSPHIAFMIWLRLQDANTGKPIRPAFYEDNFFSLLPGESKTVNIEYNGEIDPAKTRIVVDGWNIARSQYQNGKFTELPDVRPAKPANLALGKPATASSSVEGSAAGFVTDLDGSSRWISARTDDQWIAIDLGSPTSFSSVGLVWEAAYAKDYQIQVSDDGTTWRDAIHVTDGKGGEVTLKFPPVTARHVRMLGNKRASQYGFSLYDFSVRP